MEVISLEEISLFSQKKKKKWFKKHMVTLEIFQLAKKIILKLAVYQANCNRLK